MWMNPLANAGLPMIGLYWPPVWVALVPIIWLEAWFARRVLGLTWRRAWIGVGVGNVLSTLVGIPIMWVLLAGLRLRYFGSASGLPDPLKFLYAATLQSPWLVPYERHLWWMIPVAALSLTVVFFVVSATIEGFLMRLFNPNLVGRTIVRWAWQANTASYGGLVVIVVLYTHLVPVAVTRLYSPAMEFLYRQAVHLSR